MRRALWLVVYAFGALGEMLFAWLKAHAEERVKGKKEPPKEP